VAMRKLRLGGKKTELRKGWVEDLARRETEDRSRKEREHVFFASRRV
jgi:hypothetical protein